MNARAYFCILRPVRTLLIAVFYGWIFGFNIFRYMIRLERAETIFFTLTVIAPLFLGTLLLGPIHEVMHRSFSAVLPGVRVALRRWHMGAVSVVAVLLLVGVQSPSTLVPTAASLGYILIGLTVPLLNKRKLTAWAMVSKTTGILAFYAFLMMPSRSLILSVGNHVPWIILLAGIGFAVFCFCRGFSGRSVRERCRRRQLIFCYQSLGPLPGTGFSDVTRYLQSENARAISEKKTGQIGRDWTTQVVGSSVRAWTNVIHHTRFGRVGHARTVTTFILMGFAPVVSVIVASYAFARFTPGPAVSFVEFYGQFADSCRLGSDSGGPAEFFFGIVPLFGVILVTLAGVVAIGSTFPFPISRQRRADAVFTEMIRLGALACLGYSAALFIAVIVACFVGDRSLQTELFGRPLVGALVVPPLALLNLATLHLIARIRWLMSPGGFILIFLFGMVVVTAAGALLGKLGPNWFVQQLGVPGSALMSFGFLTWFPVMGLSLWLFRFAMSRHYKKCDLTNPVPWAKAFYPGA